MINVKFRKLFSLLMVGLYIVGTIGGFGHLVFIKEWPTAIAIVALAFMAFPKFRDYWDFVCDADRTQ